MCLRMNYVMGSMGYQVPGGAGATTQQLPSSSKRRRGHSSTGLVVVADSIGGNYDGEAVASGKTIAAAGAKRVGKFGTK